MPGFFVGVVGVVGAGVGGEVAGGSVSGGEVAAGAVAGPTAGAVTVGAVAGPTVGAAAGPTVGAVVGAPLVGASAFGAAVAVMSASPGLDGGKIAGDALVTLLEVMSARVVAQLAVGATRSKRDDHGDFTDPDTLAEVADLVRTLTAAAS